MHLAARIGVAVLLAATAVAAQTGSARRDVPTNAQQDARAPILLTGRITSAADSRPLRRALVTVRVGGRLYARALTDDEGRYQLEAPPGVPYVLAIQKSSYLITSLQRPAARAAQGTMDVSLAPGGVISGRVTDPGGNPVVSTRVRLQRVGAEVLEAWATTDDVGTYRVGGLLPGRYRVETIGRPEYSSPFDSLRQLESSSRERVLLNNPLDSPSSEAVIVEASSGAVADATLTYRSPAVILPYANVGGAIAGQINDEAGDPAAGLSVQLWRLEVDNGVVTATRYNGPRITDDRGQYRLFHIKAGRYALVVSDETPQIVDRRASWLPVYYPGTPSPADAVALDVGRSQELSGTNMIFTHQEGARVFGVALNAAGRPLQNPISLLTQNQELPVTPTRQTVQVDADGGFSFEAVPPGDYVLRAAPDMAPAATRFVGSDVATVSTLFTISQRENEFGMQPVHVSDADIGPLVFQTTPTATLRGHIEFEGVPPVRPNFHITAFTTDPLFNLTGRPSDGTIAEATVNPDTLTFELPRLTGPIRLRLTAAPLNAWLKSALVGGVNAAESPVMFTSSRDSRDDVTVVVATTAATISGRTTSASGQPMPGVQVIVFPIDREHWYIGSPYVQSMFSNETGLFTLTTVLPGEYWIVAVDADGNQMQRRESERSGFFDALIASARQITVGDGQTITVSPRIVTMNK